MEPERFLFYDSSTAQRTRNKTEVKADLTIRLGL